MSSIPNSSSLLEGIHKAEIDYEFDLVQLYTETLLNKIESYAEDNNWEWSDSEASLRSETSWEIASQDEPQTPYFQLTRDHDDISFHVDVSKEDYVIEGIRTGTESSSEYSSQNAQDLYSIEVPYFYEDSELEKLFE